MLKIVFFIFTLLFLSNVQGYDNCLNEEEVSESCIKKLYETNEHTYLVKEIDEVKFKNKSDGLAIKIDSLFKLARYDEIELNINKLPASFKNTLYYKMLLLKTSFARKRFNQALELMESVKEEYPHYYLNSELECMKADIMLFRKQYDGAVENYDKCLKIKPNVFSSYNRLLALEKNGPPQNILIKEYLEHYELYQETFLSDKVIDRLVQMKKKSGFPAFPSPYYSRWLAVMRKGSKLDIFFNDEFLEIPYPANSEIIKYLVDKKRFADALNMLETAIAAFESDCEVKFNCVVEKYRTLVTSGQDKAAADFMVSVAGEFPALKRDRLLFFAGTIYFDAGFVKEGKKILEEIVYSNASSKYFLLALFRLGLIHLDEGNELYAFTLWINFLYKPEVNPTKYISGKIVYDAIEGLIQTIERLNGFCTALSDIDASCLLHNVCQENGGSRFITYYDFLYFHLIEREDFKKKIELKKESYVETWKKNSACEEVGENEVLEQLKSVSKLTMQTEPAKMISFFLNIKHRDGVEFYLQYIDSVIGFREKKYSGFEEILPERKGHYELSAKLTEFKLKSGVALNHYFKKAGNLVNHHFDSVGPELSYSPHYGKASDWKLLYPTPHLDEVLKLSVEFDVPVQFIYSIMRAETQYHDHLSSRVGALGLMQIMPATFEKISKFSGIKIKNPMDPYDSMRAAVWYLSKLLKRFDNNYALAAAAYNAGPHRVAEWLIRYKGSRKYVFIEMIPFYETRNYVKKVLRFMEIYSYLYEGVFYDLELKGVMNIEEDPSVINF